MTNHCFAEQLVYGVIGKHSARSGGAGSIPATQLERRLNAVMRSVSERRLNLDGSRHRLESGWSRMGWGSTPQVSAKQVTFPD